MTGRLTDLQDRRFYRLVATNTIKREGLQTKRKFLCDCGKETWMDLEDFFSWLKDIGKVYNDR